MKVTIRDRSGESSWGTGGYITPHVVTVEIADTCRQCGGLRGEPHGLNQCDDGAYYWVQVWENPCGHVDWYADVVREAAVLAAAAGRVPGLPIGYGDAVAVRDARQLGDRLAARPAAGPWYVVGVTGVAAAIGLSPLTPLEFAAVTPLSNLRRTGGR